MALQGFQHATYILVPLTGVNSSLRDRDTNDFDILLRLLFIRLCILDLVNHIQALNGTPEYRMLIVQPGLSTVSHVPIRG